MLYFMHVEDFIDRTKCLISKLTSQGFKIPLLRRTFDKFASRNYELLFKYNHSLMTLLLVVADTSLVYHLMVFVVFYTLMVYVSPGGLQ